jgi:hypothetical protein
MRKLMVAVAVVGLALTAGCKRSEVQEERRDLAEAQREAQRDIAEAREDAREARADIQREEQEEIADARRDVAEEQQDLAEAEAGREHAETVQGRVRSTTGDSLVLSVPARNNAELKLKTDDKTRVTQNDLTVDLDDFEEGTEVRASYVMEGEDLVARDVVIITPVMEK